MTTQPYFATNINGEPIGSNQDHFPKHHSHVHQKVSPCIAIYKGMVLESPHESPPEIPVVELQANRGGKHFEQKEWKEFRIQRTTFNDFFFAILFYFHMVAIVSMGFKFIPLMYADLTNQYSILDNNEFSNRNRQLISSYLHAPISETFFLGTCTFLLQFIKTGYLTSSSLFFSDNRMLENTQDYEFSRIKSNKIIFMISISGAVGLALSSLTISLMLCFPKVVIKLTFLWNLILALLILVIGIFANEPFFMVLGMVSLLLIAIYTYKVWDRIPFATANIITSGSAMKHNFGLTFFAFFSTAVLFIFIIFWFFTAASTLYAQGNCSGLQCSNEIDGFLLFFFLFSFVWTYQVVKNVLHFTVAGTVATWWFTPSEANSYCSSAVKLSWIRAISFSFGSICLGSLVVPFVEVIQRIVWATLGEDTENVRCNCNGRILSYIESLKDCFNIWAYAFAAVYGNDFRKASYNVMDLFKTRGWIAIINNNAVDIALLMASLGVVATTGIAAYTISELYGLHLGAVGPFIIGTGMSSVLTSILMSVVGSGVNAVIVCYAAAPSAFQRNHPALSRQMFYEWKCSWPSSFLY